MTHPIDPAALLALASKATPGPWRNGADPSHFDSPEVTDDKTFSYYVTTDADAAFIAAASPSVVAALCERVERLERWIEQTKAERDVLFEANMVVHDEERPIRTKARLQAARIEALEAGLKEACEIGTGLADWTRDHFTGAARSKAVQFKARIAALRELAEGKQ